MARAAKGQRVANRMKFAPLAVVLLQNSWLYPWDPIDIAVSAGIIRLAAGPVGPAWLAGLFLVALLNRESSLFVGLFLVIDQVVVRSDRFRPCLRPRFSGRLAVGLGMMAGSVMVVEALRRLLLVRQVFTPRPDGMPSATANGDAQLQFYNNLHELTQHLGGTAGVPAYELGFVLLFVFVAGRVRSADPRLAKLAILTLFELVSFSLFGVLSELRVFSGIVPFVALFLATSFAIRAPDRKTGA